MELPEAAPLDVAEIKREALMLIKNRVRGQHSNSKVIRLCIEVEQLRSKLSDETAFNEGWQEHIADLLEAIKPFVLYGPNRKDLLCSAWDFEKLTKAYNAAYLAVQPEMQR